MAGIGRDAIDLVECYDSFTITVLMTLEALGFCKPGEGGAFVSGQRTAPGGDFPLNTNGGGLSYCHPGMYGIFLLVEAVRQLRGEAGERQVRQRAHGACSRHRRHPVVGRDRHSGQSLRRAVDERYSTRSRNPSSIPAPSRSGTRPASTGCRSRAAGPAASTISIRANFARIAIPTISNGPMSAASGEIYTFTIARKPAGPVFAADVPYVIAMIALDEGPRMLTNIVTDDVEQVRHRRPGDGAVRRRHARAYLAEIRSSTRPDMDNVADSRRDRPRLAKA